MPFLRLSAMRLWHAESWGERTVLGIGTSRSAASRLREPFEGLVPDDFQVLEFDRRQRFRWNPLVVVERIDWEVLAVHSDAPVRKLAAESLETEQKRKRTSRA